MATDCEELSPNARKIFEKLKVFYPPDSWKNPQFTEEGKVHESGSSWYDLRKSKDRNKLMEEKKNFLGYVVELNAISHYEENGSLEGFFEKQYSRLMTNALGILMLLNDLDFQIETLDLVDE